MKKRKNIVLLFYIYLNYLIYLKPTVESCNYTYISFFILLHLTSILLPDSYIVVQESAVKTNTPASASHRSFRLALMNGVLRHASRPVGGCSSVQSECVRY